MKYYRSVFDVEYRGRTARVSSDFMEGIEIFKLKWPDGSFDLIYMDIVDDVVMWQSKMHLPQNKIEEIGSLIEKKLQHSTIVS